VHVVKELQTHLAFLIAERWDQ